ncbi:MAG: hypothetical protein ACYDC2_04820 [Solirubrobacteraceae bacterium]
MGLLVAWLLADPHTPDLAAQVYRVELFKSAGFAVYDARWYAGHHLPGYSLLFGPLGALLGPRALGAACALISTVLFGRLVASLYDRVAAATAAFAVGAVGDVWLGRLSFALGVTFALGAAVAMRRGRARPAAAAAVLCAAASPVAGLLLGLSGLVLSVHERAARGLLLLALPAAAVVVPLAVLFPEGGYEPFPLLSFLATAAVVIAFLVALPSGARLLRTGALVYLVACLACLLVRTPVGSNVARLAPLLAAPLLLCELGARGWGSRAGRHGGTLRGRALALFALAGIGTWVVWGPVRETEAVAGSAATSASYYVPLERFLSGLGGPPVRIEVPLTRSHWEAALLAPTVSLARGWEKQLDERYDGPLLRPGLSPGAYLQWLRHEAVAYVALPDARLDPSSASEGTLLRRGQPYLREVFRSAHWRVFAVRGAAPLASAPAVVTRLGHDAFSLRFAAAGTTLVRIHYTRWFALTAGAGCVSSGGEGFTSVRSRAAGTVTVRASFSLARAFDGGPACRG